MDVVKYEDCCKTCNCNHKSRIYLKGNPKKYTINVTPEKTTTSKQLDGYVYSYDINAYPNGGDQDGFYYKRIN